MHNILKQIPKCVSELINKTDLYFLIPFLFFGLLVTFRSTSARIKVRRVVGPDLGPNCLQRLSTDDNRRRSFHRLRATIVFITMPFLAGKEYGNLNNGDSLSRL